MTEGENAVMERHQPTVFDPSPNQVNSQAQIEKLPTRDHSVLAFSQLTDRVGRFPARCNAFEVYYPTFALQRAVGGWH